MKSVLCSRCYAFSAHPLLAPLAAALVYGAWVAVLNRASDTWWLPALSHGFYAALATLLTQRWVLLLRRRWGPGWQAGLFVMLVTMGLLVGVPWLVQSLAGNQAVAVSILPGVMIGGVYVVVLIIGHRADAGH
ncbi:MAG: hypothetical protein EA401_10195 [Planctomycetota bacterium]|nr:MAG: hypothetical protein EA401_10195 [Planctomycetota bacterium]